MDAERLALGTVQFGLAYGATNESGQVPSDEAAQILTGARAGGMDTLDTAPAYGTAESVLGEIGIAGWQVVTKLPELSDDVGDVTDWAMSSVTRSLDDLQIDRLHGVLLHRPLQLRGPRGAELHDALVALRQQGLAAKVGVSVYGPDQLDATWSDDFDLVQAPFNVFDRRLASSGWLDRLTESGVEIHTRSAFLQGVLLADRHPEYFAPWSDRFRAWNDWLVDSDLTPLQGALGTALSDPRIDRVVVGVDSGAHLDEILTSVTDELPAAPDSLATDDEALVDPSRWAL